MGVVGLFAFPIWGWCPLAGVVFLVTGLLGVVFGTLAPRLWLLHKLPLLGAPKVTLSARTAGRYKDGVLVEIGMRTPTRLDDGSVNFVVPEGVRVTPTTPSGAPIQTGSILQTKDEFGPGTRQTYWHDYLDLRRGPSVKYFGLRPPEQRMTTVRARFKLDSEKLFRTALHDFSIEFPEPADESVSPDARVAAREVRSELRRILTLLRAKLSSIEKGLAAENEPGFRFDVTQWGQYRETLANYSEPYEEAAAAYRAVEHLMMRSQTGKG